VAAQDVVFDIAPTETCVAQGGNEACIGEATSLCFNATDYGFTTVGMVQCISQEYQWWDARLNRVFGDLKANLAAQDDAFPDEPQQAPALVEMQRAWIAYRDATCEFERREWGSGTAGRPTYASCLLQETAEQALFLETRLRER
jgi:uncharacterized protein YecT (DUF1311 family)